MGGYAVGVGLLVVSVLLVVVGLMASFSAAKWCRINIC